MNSTIAGHPSFLTSDQVGLSKADQVLPTATHTSSSSSWIEGLNACAAGILRQKLPNFQLIVADTLFYNYILNTKARVAF